MCVVYLLSEQTKLRQLGGRFLLEKKGKRQASIPMDEVECVIQGKAAEITTPAIYDLMEPFRQLVIDRLVLKAVNRGQFHPEDFSYDDVLGCRLSKKAREGWISYYEVYMQRSCREYEGLAPREWIRNWIRQSADALFRNAASAV